MFPPLFIILYFLVFQFRPLSLLIEEYAGKVNKDPCSLLFRFDGDIVKASDSAESLDLENGDILDVQETEVLVL